MESLLYASVIFVALSFLLAIIIKPSNKDIPIDKKNVMRFILGWILVGFIFQLDYSESSGCLVGFDTNAIKKSFSFGAISFLLILIAYFNRDNQLGKMLIIIESLIWLSKLMLLKGGYAIGFGGVPGIAFVFYDLVAIISRLLNIRINFSNRNNDYLIIVIATFITLYLKIEFFAWPII